MTKTKYPVPWIDAMIKRLVKKRHKLYLRARKSKDPDVKIQAVQSTCSEGIERCLFTIYLRSRRIAQIPTLLSLKRLKSFGNLSSHLKKTRLGSHRSEKTENTPLLVLYKSNFTYFSANRFSNQLSPFLHFLMVASINIVNI